jgi:hypothetical protein
MNMSKTFENKKVFAAATLLFAVATIFAHATQNPDTAMVSAIHLRVPQTVTGGVSAPDASGDSALAMNAQQK